jgi:hypothetical protein
LRWVGDASVLQVALSTTTTDRQESYSGNRLTSVRLQTAKKADLTLTLSYFSAKNLALGLYGDASDVDTGTVTAESLPDNLTADDAVALDHRDVSDLVLTDSASGSPATLTEDTDYTLDADTGIVQILKVDSYTQPFQAAYSYAAAVNVPMFGSGVPERYLVLDGINTVDSNHVKLRLYRCAFDPASQLDLISNDLGTLELKGSVLYDSLNAADSNFGGFGRIEMPEAS